MLVKGATGDIKKKHIVPHLMETQSIVLSLCPDDLTKKSSTSVLRSINSDRCFSSSFVKPLAQNSRMAVEVWSITNMTSLVPFLSWLSASHMTVLYVAMCTWYCAPNYNSYLNFAVRDDVWINCDISNGSTIASSGPLYMNSPYMKFWKAHTTSPFY